MARLFESAISPASGMFWIGDSSSDDFPTLPPGLGVAGTDTLVLIGGQAPHQGGVTQVLLCESLEDIPAEIRTLVDPAWSGTIRTPSHSIEIASLEGSPYARITLNTDHHNLVVLSDDRKFPSHVVMVLSEVDPAVPPLTQSRSAAQWALPEVNDSGAPWTLLEIRRAWPWGLAVMGDLVSSDSPSGVGDGDATVWATSTVLIARVLHPADGEASVSVRRGRSTESNGINVYRGSMVFSSGRVELADAAEQDPVVFHIDPGAYRVEVFADDPQFAGKLTIDLFCDEAVSE